MSFFDWKIMVNQGQDYMQVWQIAALLTLLIAGALFGTYYKEIKGFVQRETPNLILILIILIILPFTWLTVPYYFIKKKLTKEERK